MLSISQNETNDADLTCLKKGDLDFWSIYDRYHAYLAEKEYCKIPPLKSEFQLMVREHLDRAVPQREADKSLASSNLEILALAWSDLDRLAYNLTEYAWIWVAEHREDWGSWVLAELDLLSQKRNLCADVQAAM